MTMDLEKIKAFCDDHVCRDCVLNLTRDEGMAGIDGCIFSGAGWNEIEAAYIAMEKEMEENAGV